MNIKIVCVGKLKEKYFKDAIAEYQKRLSRFAKVTIVQVPDEKAPEKFSEAEDEKVKEIEGQRILSKIKDKEYVYVTAIKGKQRSSEKFKIWVLMDIPTLLLSSEEVWEQAMQLINVQMT